MDYDALDDLTAYGTQLRRGVGSAEHKVVGDGAKAAQVEDAEVLRFFVIGVKGAGAGEFEVFHG